MSLLEILKNNPEQLKEKQLQQLIAFSGSGVLSDSGKAKDELREYLSNVETSELQRYAEECLQKSFKDSGLALQDIVNELGKRIGAKVTPGRYRGTTGEIGNDGLWVFPEGNSIVVEVKTTDAYRINLSTIHGYWKALQEKGILKKEESSILIVVGRQDTGDLEAQIRGSKHAWDVRLISVDALIRLVGIKEDLEDPNIIQQIHHILVPREYTRLDDIAELLFSTTADLKQDEDPEPKPEKNKKKKPKFVPVAFHQQCVDIVASKIEVKLLKRSRGKFSTPDESTALTCSVSKEHDSDTYPNYWFAFHPHQKEFLQEAEESWAVFGCGSSAVTIMIPLYDLVEWLDGLWVTETTEGKMYWHVLIYKTKTGYELRRKKGEDRIDLSDYVINQGAV